MPLAPAPVDVASKPTLASYNIRPDAFDPRRPGPPNKLQTSKGRDDALLAVLDRHSEVADAKVRSRDYKGAITLLRRTYALVNAHSSPAPEGGRALVVRLATACLRLQLCAALSRIGRHGPALDEATVAKLEMEEIWESLTGAAVEMAMAEAGGDTTKPHPVLRSHICNPPSWLERAIACSVQSRLCIAVEMEYMLLAEGPNPPGQEAEEPDLALLPPIEDHLLQTDLADDELQWQGQVGMPTSPLTPAEQIEQLYREAIDLATRLLPAKHPLVRDAEKAAATAMQRQLARLEVGATSKASPVHDAELLPVTVESKEPPQEEVEASSIQPSPTGVRRVSLPASSIQPSPTGVRRVSLPEEDKESEASLPYLPRDLLTRNKRGGRSLFASKSMPSLQSALDKIDDEDTFPSEAEKDTLFRRNTDSQSHGDWVRRSPPGDVFYRSLPHSFREATGESRSASRRRRKKKASQQEGLQASTDSFDSGDPFKEWAKEFMHLENMTLFQRKLLTLEGIGSLHTDMKIETKRFRQVMHDLELHGGEERLGNNRILYTDAGMKAFRIGQARSEAVRKAAWKATPYAQKCADREKELFAYYGMSRQYEKGVDIKSLRKILEESFERTPEQKAKRKKEEEERRRQEQEEAEEKKRELSQIGFRKSRSRTQKLGKDRSMGATR